MAEYADETYFGCCAPVIELSQFGITSAVLVVEFSTKANIHQTTNTTDPLSGRRKKKCKFA